MFHTKTLTAIGLASIALLVVPAIPASAQGTHIVASHMVAKRAEHTMTRLLSGKVLAVGGTDPFSSYAALRSVEVYDPATDIWIQLPDLNAGRKEHAATLLDDGRVLVTGGVDPVSVAYSPNFFVLNSAEVIDPASGISSLVGPMTEYRYSHQATKLADGRVLITGGYHNAGLASPTSAGSYPLTPTASAEIFNPADNTFTAIPSMTRARSGHSATLMADGKVLIVGGDNLTPATAEIYDPATNTFTAVSSLANARRATQGAVLLNDGRVLIAGGPLNDVTAEYFDPATRTFVSLGSMTARFGYWGVIAKMTDGRVYLYEDGHAQLFDPSTNTFTALGAAGVGELFPAGAALSDNRVIVSGGQDFVPFTFVSRDATRIFVPNATPSASAGVDQTLSPGAGCVAPVTLDATGSTDPDGDTLAYEWTSNGAIVGNTATVALSLAPGTYTYTLTVSDGHGGSATDDVVITVADTMPPSFAAPLPVTLEQEGPAGTHYVVTLPVATDNCDPSPIVSVSGVPSGSIFPAGSTPLTFSARDSRGNTASVTIAITVHDTTAPALTVPSSITQEATSAAGATVSFATSASDAVTASPAITCTPASGSTFALGPTSVQCAATDTAGNRTEKSFVVTVRDTTPPALTLPADITIEATLPGGARPSWTASASDLVSGATAVVCTPASGSLFPVGATLVTCTAQDAAGNRGSDSFHVTVTDHTPPVITTVSSNPGSLWPPNHRMVPVAISIGASDLVSATACRVTGVSSNQPANGIGDGNTPVDWTVAGDRVVNLRAERSGNGDRVYTIAVSCTDAAGNASSGATSVIVPHDRGR